MQDFVLGVDGGGSTTRVALVSFDGQLLAEGSAGSGNLHDVGEEVLGNHLDRARRAAFGSLGLEPRPASAAFFGMASVVTPEDRARVARLASAFAPGESIHVDHDLRISLAGGLAGRPGIAVIAGTGSSCYGRNAEGNTWMAGGWGSLLDDRGSAFDLGRGALAACVREVDGRGPRTRLRERIREHLELSNWRELLSKVDEGELSRSGIAALAPLVTEAALDGDEVARGLIEAGVEELALAVQAVASKLDMSDPEVSPTGGLAAAGPVHREPFERAVRRRLPGARVVDPRLSPVHGAGLLALETLGIEWSREVGSPPQP